MLQGQTYPNILQQVHSPSWSIRILMYPSIPHWKGWVKCYLLCTLTFPVFHIRCALHSVSSCFRVFTIIARVSRKPLKSAACLCQMMTLARRTTAALWPVYVRPSWAPTRKAAFPGAHVLSREVRIKEHCENICYQHKLTCRSVVIDGQHFPDCKYIVTNNAAGTRLIPQVWVLLSWTYLWCGVERKCLNSHFPAFYTSF